jgi:hypothetical protein
MSMTLTMPVPAELAGIVTLLHNSNAHWAITYERDGVGDTRRGAIEIYRASDTIWKMAVRAGFVESPVVNTTTGAGMTILIADYEIRPGLVLAPS